MIFRPELAAMVIAGEDRDETSVQREPALVVVA
jgi:hypothetical protein